MQDRPGADRLDRFVANPRRALWLLAMPILIGMSIQTLYMIVDMFFVGRVSPEALTALAFICLLFIAKLSYVRLDHVVILPQVAVASGLVTLVGMFYGARRGDLLREIITYAMVRTILLSIAIATAFYVLAPSLIAFFTESEGIRSLGVDYLRVVVFAYPFIGVSILTGRSLQGLGRGAPELWLSLLRVILISAPLAWAVTFWLRWPVQWVWYSSLIGTVTSASIALLWLTIGVRTAINTIGSANSSLLGGRAGAGDLPVEAAAEVAEPA